MVLDQADRHLRYPNVEKEQSCNFILRCSPQLDPISPDHLVVLLRVLIEEAGYDDCAFTALARLQTATSTQQVLAYISPN